MAEGRAKTGHMQDELDHSTTEERTPEDGKSQPERLLIICLLILERVCYVSQAGLELIQ